MSESERSTLAKFSITSVKELLDSSKWDDFKRTADAWKVNNDLDEALPPDATSAETTLWNRRQFKACAQLRTRLTKAGSDHVEDIVTIPVMLVSLKAKYEEKQEGTFGEAYHKFTSLSLEGCKGIADYNNKFDLYLAELHKYPEVIICRPLQVKQYLEGLGTAFSSWLTNFNLSHSVLKNGAIDGVSLEIAQTAARVEEQKLSSELNTVAMMASRKRKSPDQLHQQRNGNKPRELKQCLRHGPGGHTSAECISLHPELVEEFRRKHPEKAAQRDRNVARFKAETEANKAASQPVEEHHHDGKLSFTYSSGESNRF